MSRNWRAVLLRSTPILGYTRAPCLAAESSAKDYPPPGMCAHSIHTYTIYRYGFSDFAKFGMMGFRLSGIWDNGYMVFLFKCPSHIK